MSNLNLNIRLKAFEQATKPFKAVIMSSKKLQDQISKAKVEIADTSAQNRLIKSHGKLSNRINSSRDKLSQLRAQLRTAEQATKSATETTKKQSDAIGALKKKINNLDRGLDNNRRKWLDNSRALKNAGINTRDLGNEETRLKSKLGAASERLKRYNATVKQTAANTRNAARQSARFNKALQNTANIGISGAAGVATGRTLARGGAQIAGSGINYEEQIVRVAAISGISKNSEDFAKLDALAKKLGASTQFSANQVGQGMEFLAMAGFDVNQTLASMPALLDVAKVGNLELGNAANIVSNIMGGFNIKAHESGRVGDVIAATITRSNVSVEQLGETMKKVAPIINSVNGSLEDGAALTGLLGNIGIHEEAGTVIKNIYTRLASPPTAAAKQMKKLGVTTRDAAGNLLPVVNILAQINDATKNLGSADRLAAFSDIAGLRAIAGATNLAFLESNGGITKFINELKNIQGEAAKISAQMSDNTRGDIIAMQSAWEGLSIELFSTQTSPLRAVVKDITTVIRRAQEWVTRNPETAALLIKTAALITGVVLVLGSLGIAFAAVATPILLFSKLLVGIKLFAFIQLVGSAILWIGKISRVMVLFNLIMTANPIGLVIVAIAALIAAGIALYKNWDKVKAWFKGFFSWFTDKFKLVGRIVSGVSSLVSAAFGNDESIKKTVEIAENAQLNIVQNNPDLVAGVANANNVQTRADSINIAPPIKVGGNKVSQTNSTNYDIQVNAAPGQDAEQIAREIRRELDARDREAQAQQNTSSFDGIY